MNLEENGDVLWVASPGAEDLPLISCETYDMFHTSVTGLVIRFGSYQGHIIEFRVSPAELSNTSQYCINDQDALYRINCVNALRLQYFK